jgi:hypothetical protein
MPGTDTDNRRGQMPDTLRIEADPLAERPRALLMRTL